ncbi:epidermal retinol dehydrogenase 2-like [Homalodisca vitripennis]|uniref:epidermal retinol dehydrogenase 2-like n=1 Tax=Homalodisca vitripennis TaxID=197043 RepID=UPI001EEAEF58|nr:epidermal retinol dehydrogenase 2-like [Homalodisca vitripennis]
MATSDMAETGLRIQDIPLLVVRCLIAVYYTVYLSVRQIYRFFYPPPGKSLKEKHVLVTGAGGALGRELSLCFAREGCRVTCVDVNLPECEETVGLVSKISEKPARCYRLDVTDREAVAAFAKQLELEVGPLDILVNNAGIVQAGGLLDVTDMQISKIIDVNLMAHFWTIRAFLPTMLARNTGHVVAISSAAALAVASNIGPYTASKAAVSGLMGCLREELRKQRTSVYCTTVQPFFLAPPEHKKHWEVKSVLPDITASSVAVSTVDAVKHNAVTLTIPTYLFFIMYMVRFIPAAASDMWRDVFAANIDSVNNSKTKSQ